MGYIVDPFTDMAAETDAIAGPFLLPLCRLPLALVLLVRVLALNEEPERVERSSG